MLIITVTVDYNGHADTLDCLASLRRAGLPQMPIIVVDNGSAEPLRLTTEDPNAQLIRLERNLGFAGGFNTGLRRALEMGAEAVFMLNNDTIAGDGLLLHLVSRLEGDVGIVAPRIFYADDPQRVWSDGFKANSLTLEMRRDRRGKREQLDDETISVVDYVTGCAMLIDSRVLEAVGLFDEQFFAYYEDLDFCIRARKAGFRILNVASAHLWHKVASTTGLQSPYRYYLMAYGSIRFFAKHAGWRWPFVAVARVGNLIKTTALLSWQRRFDLLKAYVNGIAQGLQDVYRG